MDSIVMYKKNVNKYCSICGKPIVYGINGAQISNYCIECQPITYYYNPAPIRNNYSYEELNSLEDRCIND